MRTVTVGFRRKNSREEPEVYKSKPLVEEQVSVQRLILLVSASDATKKDSSEDTTVKDFAENNAKEGIE